ncbi:MAG: hypothetical protein LBD58_11175 [Treponema sp.]|nr:hypothetical protein [Treponema sp.]
MAGRIKGVVYADIKIEEVMNKRTLYEMNKYILNKIIDFGDFKFFRLECAELSI